jgi:hypothetical protein
MSGGNASAAAADPIWTPPRGDEDAPHLARLRDAPLVPMFVMGLHRSGTTWLYEQLDRLLPVASATAHDVLAYPRLLDLQARGALEMDRAALDAHFRALGLVDRQIDAIALSHATVEEYGWVLLRQSGRPWLDRRSAPVLTEVCRKLAAIRPQARAVLLKNPWDTGGGPQIRALFPAAKFVFLSRDPVWIVDSQLRNGFLFKDVETPYFDALIQPSLRARLAVDALRRMSRLVGERAFTSAAMRLLMSRVTRELERYRRSRDGLPPAARIEVRYEDLLRDPATHLGRVIEFLDLPPRGHPATVRPKPRERALHPAVASRRAAFVASLSQRGLWEPRVAVASSV